MLLLLCILLFSFFRAEIDTTLRCRTEQDCLKFNTFCEGQYRCNSSWRCTASIRDYNPCNAIQHSVNEFIGKYRGIYTMSVVCIESIQACVELYYCIKDSDCDDGLYCNGIERCVAGQCLPSLSTTHLCTPCDEYIKCGSTKSATISALLVEEEAPANLTSIYIMIAVFTIVGSIVVSIAVLNICRVASQSR